MNREFQWAEAVTEKIIKKVKLTAARSRGKIPYTTVDGVFDDWSSPDKISWWTNGFYAGLLWQLYYASDRSEPLFKNSAKAIEDKLDASLMDYNGMDHDSGFKWLLTSVANYKLTGNKKSMNRALLAAANLAGRFNPAGNFIRAWNDWAGENHSGWAIIDCMMNLPLLYWAGDITSDPRFYHIATLHADTAIKAFIRPDGSANHIVRFDPESGNIMESLGGQGMGTGSSWTRGQAWALYGFTLSYIHTKNKKYLDAANKISCYFISNIPDSGFIPVDFCQSSDCIWEDSSAAAIAACGLLELEKYTDSEFKDRYHNTAVKLLYTLEKYRCNWDDNIDNIIENCSASYHDERHNFSIIYGDYYFTEGILKLCGKELFLW